MIMRDYFKDSYREARDLFREIAERKGATLNRYVLPGFKGINGEDLSMDVAIFGDLAAKKSIVVASGIHGTEGYAGSGIQNLLMDKGIFEELDPDVKVVLIHAINPYGFSHGRRVNENGVDLFHNIRDLSKPLSNEGYAQLHGFLFPDEFEGPKKAEADAALLRYQEIRGEEDFFTAACSGQSAYPDGYCYAGNIPEWSNIQFREMIRKYLSHDSQIVFFDLHTGQGEEGVADIMFMDQNQSIYRKASEWFPKIRHDPYDRGLTYAIVDELPQAEVMPIIIEYGTVQGKVLEANRGDVWVHTKGDLNTELGRKLKRLMKDALYVDTDSWRSRIYAQAEELILNVLSHMKG